MSHVCFTQLVQPPWRGDVWSARRPSGPLAHVRPSSFRQPLGVESPPMRGCDVGLLSLRWFPRSRSTATPIRRSTAIRLAGRDIGLRARGYRTHDRRTSEAGPLDGGPHPALAACYEELVRHLRGRGLRRVCPTDWRERIEECLGYAASVSFRRHVHRRVGQRPLPNGSQPRQGPWAMAGTADGD